MTVSKYPYFLLFSAIALTSSFVTADLIEIAPNGITDFFGNQDMTADAGDAAGLLFDEARGGGGDTAAQAAFNPTRSLVGVNGNNDNFAAGLTTGNAGAVTFSGVGFALRGGTTASEAQLTIRYLGADGVFGNADDVTIGTVSDSINFTVTGEYAWQFDNNLQFNWDGLNDRFRFEIVGLDGNLRFKQRSVGESPSGQGGLTLSVGGNFSAIPEPASSALCCGLMLFAAARRRR